MKQEIDIESLVRLFQSRYDLMLGIARRYAPFPDLAYDIVQQVFVDFAENVAKSQWDCERDLTPMLCRITKTRAIQCWQQQMKNTSTLLRAFDEQFVSAYREHEDEADLHDDDIDSLNDCLDKLPEHARNLIDEHYFKETPFDEIARDKQCSVESVRQLLYRIRIKLRQCMNRKNHDRSGRT